jgi:hypothetical protein
MDKDYWELNQINQHTDSHTLVRDYRRIKRQFEQLLVQKDFEDYIDSKLEDQNRISLKSDQIEELGQIFLDSYTQELRDYCENTDMTLKEARDQVFDDSLDDPLYDSFKRAVKEEFYERMPQLF